MAKAINWPPQFRDEIIAEDSKRERIALRLGELYYQNRYWVPGEVVDIRVNHQKIRKATVIGDLRQCAVGELTEADFRRLKPGLDSHKAVIRFLAQTYDQPVDEQTRVTVVTYCNQPVIPEEMDVQDDPHMTP